jgi:hypothetical protein
MVALRVPNPFAHPEAMHNVDPRFRILLRFVLHNFLLGTPRWLPIRRPTVEAVCEAGAQTRNHSAHCERSLSASIGNCPLAQAWAEAIGQGQG